MGRNVAEPKEANRIREIAFVGSIIRQRRMFISEWGLTHPAVRDIEHGEQISQLWSTSKYP